MVYGNFNNIKILLGQQNTDVNNDKINLYHQKAFNWINSKLINIETVLPVPNPTPQLINYEENLASAYFYRGESGDSELAAQIEMDFQTNYMRNAYNRPRVVTRCY